MQLTATQLDFVMEFDQLYPVTPDGLNEARAKVTVNATSKLILTGRLGWLNYDFNSPPMFGDLGGSPVATSAAKAGNGLGDTYTITGSAFACFECPVNTGCIEGYNGV